jgi:addiction module HigA family antidote
MSRSSIITDEECVMPKDGMRPIHPGEILREEFLVELGMSVNALAHALAVPANRVSGIINGTRAVTADTALRLARYFGTSAQFWLNLQQGYDLRKAEIEAGTAIKKAIRPRAAA